LYIDQEYDAFERQKRLTNIYTQRSLYDYSKKNIADLLSQLSQNLIQSPEHSWQQVDVLEMLYFHPQHNKYDIADQTLQKANEQLDIFYALKKYRLIAGLKARAQRFQEQTEYPLLKAVTQEVAQGVLKDHALLQLYQQAIALIDANSIENFELFEVSLFSNYKQFSLTDQQFLYSTGINFLSKEFNKTQFPIQFRIVEWYKFGLQTNIIFEQHQIIEDDFANIIIAGCKAEQFDWVESFLATYQNRLVTTNPKLAQLYYQGIFYYLKADYDQALDLLQHSDKKSVYPPRLRSVLARILFEKYLLDDSYFEVLLANLTAYENYLKRNKSIAASKLKAHHNFIKVVRYFARKKLAHETKEKIRDWFFKFIQQDNPLLAKSWLAQKLKQL